MGAKDEPIEQQQPGLFDPVEDGVGRRELVFYALGDFQTRGFELAGRKMALDRLLGAFRRAYAQFEIEAFEDDDLAQCLKSAGARVSKVPSYVAKHPYRVVVPADLAERSLRYFERVRSGQ